jgi:hypothetical protein
MILIFFWLAGAVKFVEFLVEAAKEGASAISVVIYI